MSNILLAVLLVSMIPVLMTLFTPLWLAIIASVIVNFGVLSYAGARMIKAGE